jgi:hypothetical protein
LRKFEELFEKQKEEKEGTHGTAPFEKWFFTRLPKDKWRSN